MYEKYGSSLDRSVVSFSNFGCVFDWYLNFSVKSCMFMFCILSSKKGVPRILYLISATAKGTEK